MENIGTVGAEGKKAGLRYRSVQLLMTGSSPEEVVSKAMDRPAPYGRLVILLLSLYAQQQVPVYHMVLVLSAAVGRWGSPVSGCIFSTSSVP